MKKLFIVYLLLLICLSLSMFAACEKDKSNSSLSKPIKEAEIVEEEEEEAEVDEQKEAEYDTRNLYSYGSLPAYILEYFDIVETIIQSETVFQKYTYDAWGYVRQGRNSVYTRLTGVDAVPNGFTITKTYAWFIFNRQIKIEVSAKPAYRNAIFAGSFIFDDVGKMNGKWTALGQKQTIDLSQDGNLTCVWDVTATATAAPPAGYYILTILGNVKIPKTN